MLRHGGLPRNRFAPLASTQLYFCMRATISIKASRAILGMDMGFAVVRILWSDYILARSMSLWAYRNSLAVVHSASAFDREMGRHCHTCCGPPSCHSTSQLNLNFEAVAFEQPYLDIFLVLQQGRFQIRSNLCIVVSTHVRNTFRIVMLTVEVPAV